MRKTEAKRAKTQRLLKTEGRPTPKFNKLKLNQPDYQSRLLDALNYCSYVLDDAEKAKYARAYIKEHLKMSATKVPDSEFHHLGSMCWLIENGAQVQSLAEHDTKLVNLVKKYNKEYEKNKVIKTDTSAFRTGKVIAELEGILDDVYIKKQGITQPFDILQSINGTFNIDTIYRRFRTQLIEVRKGGEGYDDLPEEQINMTCSALQIILDDCNRFKIMKTKSRVAQTKPKKKRKKK